MSGSTSTGLEIVGFFGAVELECGVEVPLARHRGGERYVRFSPVDLAHEGSPEYSLRQISEWLRDSEVTALAEALPPCRDAVVVYVTASLLEACDW